jgi:hypothetical protein
LAKIIHVKCVKGDNLMMETKSKGDMVAIRGEEIYQQQIRGVVETPENIGKMIIIDIETGEYAIDENGLISARHLHAKRPGADLYGIRIGYKSAEAIGGILERTSA